MVLAMALLIPLQGMAAASAGICMAFGHHEAPATVSHHHGGSEHNDHGVDDAPGQAHCPPCVACCATAAIVAPACGFISEAPAASAVAASPPVLSGMQPDTLDRPPLVL